MRKALNQQVVYNWVKHSSYKIKGEADTKGTRLMLMINKPTKTQYNSITKSYDILVAYYSKTIIINTRLDNYV